MSLKKRTRRLSLLAGSSLFASLAAATLLAAPTAAGAAVNPCGTDPSTGASTADTIVCAAGTYATGIEHTSEGDLNLTVTWPSNFGSGGVVTRAGELNDDLTVRFVGTLTSTTTTIPTTAPVLFDVESRAGDIVVDIAPFRGGTSNLQVTNATTTHFVRAISTSGGDVSVIRSNRSSSLVLTGAGAIAALEARSVGGGDVIIGGAGDSGGSWRATQGQYGILASVDGAGDLTITSGHSGEAQGANGVGIHATSTGSGDITIGGSGSGRLYGIFAHTTGAGDVTITSSGNASSTNGIAGIWARTGTGLLTIAASGGGGAGTGVLIEAGGDVDFTGSGSGAQYGIDIANVLTGTTTTLNLTGSSTGGLAGIRAAGAGDLVVKVRNVGLLNFDFSGMASPIDVKVIEGGRWSPPTGASTVSGSNYALTIEPGGLLVAGTQVSNQLEYLNPTVVTFADPNFVLTNTGFIVVGPGGIGGSHEAELRLEGLNEFRHSGVILMGSQGASFGFPAIPNPFGISGSFRSDVPDDSYDDVLSMPGVNWVGEGGKMLMTADISRGQNDCTRDPVTGDLGAADCLQLPGGTTEGVTYINITEKFPGDRLRPTQEGVVLVEVTGGTSAQGHFVLDPDMPGATPLFGGSLDRGLYHFAIAYNEDTQQHTMYGFTGAGAYQLAEYATATHSLWRVATGSWLDRQADLRGGIEPGVSGGVWLRVAGEIADRETMIDTVRGGQTFTFDNTAQQASYAVTGGVDLISASEGDRGWAAGLMAGYNYADIEYDAWANTGQLDGFNIGAYSSFIAGGLFLDATLNANRLILKNDVPGLRMFPEGSILDTIVVSVGAQVDAGWRFPVAETAFVEPLASLSYVRSKWDDVDVAAADITRPGINVMFDDPVSFRASLGARAGLEQDYGVVRAQYSLLGRVWNEMEGENTIFLENEAFPDEAAVAVVDDFSGQISELGVSANVYSGNGLVSGFVNLGGRVGDDYQARTGSVGVRVAW